MTGRPPVRGHGAVLPGPRTGGPAEIGGEMDESLSGPRPYEALLAKGEYRKQLILSASRRLLTRNGWRTTTLGQIARAAGISPSGLLHHFGSKKHLLEAVLDARDAYDEAHIDDSLDLLEQLAHVADRITEAPEMVAMYAVLRMENLDPDAPLHARLSGRHRAAVDTVAAGIRRGQRAGRYRPDLDSEVKAEEIVAFLNGMETSWLVDPATPVNAVFREYIAALARQLARPRDEP